MAKMFTPVMAGLIVIFSGASAYAGDYVEAVRKGNEAYRNKDYKTALEQYHVAEADLPESPELEYNMGGALYEQQSYEEATDKFSKALNSTDVQVSAQAQYNLGNTFYRAGDYLKAIESYKKALQINPEDMDAKFNLEIARKMLKENSKAQQQQNQQQQQQKQQQPQGQDPQSGQQKSENQQNQDQVDEGQQDKDKPEKQIQEQTQMSKEDAERILNSLRDDEQNLQRRVRRDKNPGEYTGKDW